MTSAAPDLRTGYIAIVHAPDGVRFVTSARSAHQIAAGLVTYVRARCDDVLWPRAARQVRELIAARQWYAAIATYFDEVGDRWDEERLELLSTDSGHYSQSAIVQQLTIRSLARYSE
jgi:hypothetical protein